MKPKKRNRNLRTITVGGHHLGHWGRVMLQYVLQGLNQLGTQLLLFIFSYLSFLQQEYLNKNNVNSNDTFYSLPSQNFNSVL